MEKMSEIVPLLIRSASSSADRKLEGDLEWTVLQLKQHIEQDWPSRPKPEDQRLVYAGKLLQDGSRLRDVLRLEDLPHPFIVHLVCRQLSPPSTSPMQTPKHSNDGLRRRATPQTSTPTGASASDVTASLSSPSTGPSQAWISSQASGLQGQDQGAAINQVVAMQQMYAQYMTQYMQYIQTATSGNPYAAAAIIHPWAAAGQAFPYDPLQQQQQPAADGAGNVLDPMAAAAAAATAAVAGGQAAAGNPAVVDDNAAARAAAGVPAGVNQAIGAEPGAANVGPNPPNVVMNANAGGLGAIEDDEEGGGLGGQRDILDWFYVASRVLVLFSIVYFYSSLARFALVAGVALVLYLYQIGFFGQTRADQQQQPQQPLQQPAEPPAGDNLIQNQVEEVRQAAGGGGAQDNATNDGPQPEMGPPPTNYIAVASTFISAFFSSIIPTDPQVA